MTTVTETISVALSTSSTGYPTGDAEKELRPSIEAPGDREVYLKESSAPHPNTLLVLGQTLSF